MPVGLKQVQAFDVRLKYQAMIADFQGWQSESPREIVAT